MNAHSESFDYGPERDVEANNLDLDSVLGSLRSRWRLALSVATASFAVSLTITAFQRPIWQGEFQIVLADKNSASNGATQALLQANPELANLIGLGNSGSQLETEVKILESPSVLMPVFEKIKRLKAQKGQVNAASESYDKWFQDSIDIRLEKGTTVLSLSYKDADKSLVLPALEAISKAYQSYSGRDRERGIRKALDYLDRQVTVYRDKSRSSLKRAQQFAVEHGLSIMSPLQGGQDVQQNPLSIEESRVRAANDIRNLTEQVRQINNHSTRPELSVPGIAIPELASKPIYQSLDDLDSLIALQRSRYTDTDRSVLSLLERRRQLVGVLRDQTLEYLQGRLQEAQARLAASARPKQTLLEYSELLREASLDQATLTRLENDRQVLVLEQARTQDPWELISTPTLIDAPVSPNIELNLLFGVLGGLTLGSLTVLVLERTRGTIYSLPELQENMPGRLLARISEPLDSRNSNEVLELLAQGQLSIDNQGTICLIPVGYTQGMLEGLRAKIESTCDRNVICTDDLVCARSATVQLLVTDIGIVTRNELIELRRDLDLQGAPIAGWILYSSGSL